MSLSEKKISVIIPVHNGENYLKEAIESALAQDYEDKEVIVVDDGSSDSTRRIIEKFGSKICPLYQEKAGVGAGRNRGVKASKGNYIAFLDHDDLWEKNKLQEQMKLLIEKGNDPLVFSQMKQFFCSQLKEEERNQIFLNQSVLPGYLAGCLLISVKRFHQVGYFSESGDLGEFIEWYSRVIDLGLPTAMVEKVMLYRRVHTTNMGRQKGIYPRASYLKTLKACIDRRRCS